MAKKKPGKGDQSGKEKPGRRQKFSESEPYLSPYGIPYPKKPKPEDPKKPKPKPPPDED